MDERTKKITLNLFLTLAVAAIITGCSLTGMTGHSLSNDQSITPGIPSFPGAQGFGASATGGRGGKVVYVTNLNPSGPGSLNNALAYRAAENPEMTQRRYILFKVSGLVSAGSYHWDDKTHIEYGDFTLAGQTSPGGILLGSLYTQKKFPDLYDSGDLHLNNIIIRHIRCRPNGVPNALDDPIRLTGAQNLIVDHSSFEWASDEAMEINSNYNMSVQNCIFGETLGGHFDRGGILIKYGNPESPNSRISLHHNTLTRIGGRLPQLSPADSQEGMGMEIEISNNLIWDPGSTMGLITPSNITNWVTETQRHYDFWVKLNYINNYMFTLDNPQIEDFRKTAGYFNVKHEESSLYSRGNRINLFPQEEDSIRVTDFGGEILEQRLDYPEIDYTATEDLMDYMVANAGSFPRDSMDSRLMSHIENRSIDTTPCNEKGADDGHQFSWSQMPLPPLDSDDDGMPDEWELHNGLNPLEQDHNGTELSLQYYGVQGYENLEVYLNRLSDHLVSGDSLTLGSPHPFPLSLGNINYQENLSPGETLNISVEETSDEIESIRLSLTHLQDPFAFPSAAPVEMTRTSTGFQYSYTLPSDITPGEYTIMVAPMGDEGERGYRCLKITVN